MSHIIYRTEFLLIHCSLSLKYDIIYGIRSFVTESAGMLWKIKRIEQKIL